MTDSFRDNLSARGIPPGSPRGDQRRRSRALRAAATDVDARRARWAWKASSSPATLARTGMAHGLDTLLDARDALRTAAGESASASCCSATARERGAEGAGGGDADSTTCSSSTPCPKDEVARYWSLLDVSIIHLWRYSRSSDSSSRRSSSNAWRWAFRCCTACWANLRIVRREGFGIVFQPGDSAQLVERIVEASPRSDAAGSAARGGYCGGASVRSEPPRRQDAEGAG